MSKPFEVIISDGQSTLQLNRVAQALRGIPKGYEKAVSRAMNRAATAGRAAAVATIRNEYTLKASTIRRHFTIEKASVGSLEALVIGKGAMLPLVQYKTRPKTDTTGNTRKPVRVQVKRKGGAKRLGSSFVFKGKILQRLGKKSLPVKEAYGPAIPLIASNDEISRNVRNVMQETFAERIDHEAGYAINEFTKKKRG